MYVPPAIPSYPCAGQKKIAARYGLVTSIDLMIQDLEDECLKPEPSDKLDDLGLSLLKWISSHRGLT